MSRRKRRVNNFTEEKNPINRQFTLPEGFGDFAAIADTASDDLKEILVFGDKDVFNLRRDPNNDLQMGHLNCHQLFSINYIPSTTKLDIQHHYAFTRC